MEQKHSEAQVFQKEIHSIQTIMDASPIGILVFSDDERIIYANKPNEMLFGKKFTWPGALKCGDFIACVNRHEDPQGCGHTPSCPTCPLSSAIRSALSAGRDAAVLAGETLVKRDSKFDSIWINYKVKGVLLDGCRAAIMVVDDITNRKRAQEDNGELQAQFVQAQKLECVGRLAGGVAHDFNNLLSVILGYVQMIMDDLDRAHPHRESLEEINQAARRARNLTRQLLVFSRKQLLEMRSLDLNELVTGFGRMLRRLIGEDIKLEITLSQKPLSILADTAQIEQALLNLAVNARDAMPDGGSLTIKTSAIELDEAYAAERPDITPGSYAVIEVIDTGCGMDNETMKHIFEPFFTTKGKEEGTGLGLATTYGIIKQHGGNIYVYSLQGRGTIFKIYLPLSFEEVEEAIHPALKREQHIATATVIIVEDDASVGRMTSRILSTHGYKVLAASGSEEAIEIARMHKGAIHLVLADVIMPGIKGPEVYRMIREYHPDARALYMSGYADKIIVRKGCLRDKTAFLQKPFTVNGLISKVREALEAEDHE